MSLRRPVAILVATLIAAPLAPVTPALAQQGVVQVIQAPVACMVADVCPQLEASVPPGTTVGATRAYFHSALSGEFVYVEGENVGGKYVFRLPRPESDAGPVTYYIDMASVGRTPDQSAMVVDRAGDCGSLLVAATSSGPDNIFGTSGEKVGTPRGFGTTCRRVIGALPAAGSVAAAGGGISTGLLIAAGAVAAGAAGLIINDRRRKPRSPSR